MPDWRPTASLENMKMRARMLQGIRAFFVDNEALEVETPILSAAAITDPQLESFSTRFNQQNYYLHTSPEFYMKRLLASGSGDIYQLARVFRLDELGKYHNPEFTMLEWYRCGFDHHQLMDEIESLLKVLLDKNTLPVKRLSYQQAFIEALQIDPLDASAGLLNECALAHGVEIPQGMNLADKDMWLDWLMVEKVAASFNKKGFTFLYNYPASQAALAKLDEKDPRVANRFELFYGELELANGFYELTDAAEQAARFADENRLREQRGQKVMPVDYALLHALESGLPACSGVALGIDRLLMILCGAENISQVTAFARELDSNLENN